MNNNDWSKFALELAKHAVPTVAKLITFVPDMGHVTRTPGNKSSVEANGTTPVCTLDPCAKPHFQRASHLMM